MTGYEVAAKYLGLHEVRNHDKLVAFLKSQGKDVFVDPATTPWCAAFVNVCERTAGNKGTGLVNARSFLSYGTPVTNPKKGDIVVFTRGGSTWQGHVAYVDGLEIAQDGTKLVRTLGGNQSDSVCIGWYRADRVLGFRRP